MTLLEFKKVLLTRPEDMDERLREYGYACGLRSVMNFEIVLQVFYVYNYTQPERLMYMRKILSGFRDGCLADGAAESARRNL